MTTLARTIALVWMMASGCQGEMGGGEATPDADTRGADAAVGGDAGGADAAIGPGRDASAGAGPDGGAERDAGDVAPEVDCFGVRAIYPTAPGGRVWCLPDDATSSNDEWRPDDGIAATDEAGVFRTDGSPRHSVVSPEGLAWWRNVEMTVHLRWRLGADDEFTLYARGERHTRGSVELDDINDGVLAPDGTRAWPGYPFSDAVTHECLGTAYKGSLATDGRVFFKKEISHTAGYTSRGGETHPFTGGLPRDRWIGFKLVIRNHDADGAVRLEAWLDRSADGSWERVAAFDDDGGWSGDPADDGCDEPPFEYDADQILTWAGPIAVLRADEQDFDFRYFSIREITPEP